MDTQDITEESLRQDIITSITLLVKQRITEKNIDNLIHGYTYDPELSLEDHVIKNLISIIVLPLHAEFRERGFRIDTSQYYDDIESEIRQTEGFQTLIGNSEQ